MAKKEKARPVLAVPIYVMVEDDAVILPTANLEFIKPSELPETGNYYVLTSTGLHINKDTTIVKALTPVDNIPVLANFSSAAKLKLPKLPPIIFARAWKFFRTVWEEHKSECEVMLLWNEAERLYDLWCPEQEVSMSSVDYEMSGALAATPDKWKNVGTIHSHCDFGAYHSGTDVHDEIDADGIHVTLGHVDQGDCSVASSIKIGTQRWSVPPENVILGLDRTTGTLQKKTQYVSVNSRDNFFKIELSEGEQELLNGPFTKQINEEWMSKVTKKSYTNWQGGGGTVWVREEEEEEAGEWQMRAGTWQFISDEQIQEEAEAEAEAGIADAETEDGENA